MHSRVAASLAALAALGAVLAAGCGAPAAGPQVHRTGTSSGATSSGSAPTGLVQTDGPQSSPTRSATAHPSITVIAPPDGPGTTATAATDTGGTIAATGTANAGGSEPRVTPTRTSAPAPTHTATAPTNATPGPVDGKVVVIDPGHNGGNAAHPEIIRKQVPAGFGRYKDCNTTGTATNAGYPEHAFNWQVALSLRDALQAKGVTVVMTRDTDSGVGPCVNDRAAIGNQANADAVVSIHGDGEAPGVQGFYVMTASRAPAGDAMAQKSAALASAIRDAVVDAGFPLSNTLGSQGLWKRSDLAGLNLSLRPTVMLECGNMRNATEAALMSSAKGQQRYAAGIAAGVLAFLG